jgi:hypothetical protein
MIPSNGLNLVWLLAGKGKYLGIDPAKHAMGKRYWLMDFCDHGSNYRMLDMQVTCLKTRKENRTLFGLL